MSVERHSEHDLALLMEYELGTLDPNQRRGLEDQLTRDPMLATELRDLRELLAEIPPPMPPGSSGRSRLLASVAAGSRLEGFAGALASLFDVGVSRARGLLRLVDDESVWLSMGGGCSLMHIRGGPAVAGADVGLVRVEAGGAFPNHRHLGDERTLILQGRVRDSRGCLAGPGERMDMPRDTEHALVALPGDPLIYAVVAWGVEIPGVVLQTPEDEQVQ